MGGTRPVLPDIGLAGTVLIPAICDIPNLARVPVAITPSTGQYGSAEIPSHSEESPIVEPLHPLMKASDMQSFEGVPGVGDRRRRCRAAQGAAPHPGRR